MPNDETQATASPSKPAKVEPGPHRLDCPVRPAFPPPTAGRRVWIYVAREGYVRIPYAERPSQRMRIEHAGGVWDPDAREWAFSNQKARDKLQQELDVERGKVDGNVEMRAVSLAPGLNLLGSELWRELSRLEHVSKRAEVVFEVDPRDERPRAMTDFVKRTGVREALVALLEVEGLGETVIVAVRKQLRDIERGKIAAKVSRAG